MTYPPDQRVFSVPGADTDLDAIDAQVEFYEITKFLRWNVRILEQAWRNTKTGDLLWEPVPEKEEME